MQCLYVNHRCQFSLRGLAEYPGRAFQQLITPLLDLVRMDVKLLCNLNQSSFTLDCGYSYFRLEGRAVSPRAVVSSWSSPRLQHHAAVARKIHLSLLFSFPEPPLYQKQRLASENGWRSTTTSAYILRLAGNHLPWSIHKGKKKPT
jgi:hypothetical protein